MADVANGRVLEDRSAARVAAVALLACLVSALFYYKWGGALRAYAGVQASGKLAVNPAVLLEGGAVASVVAYFAKIWPALVYGLLIGAALRAGVPQSWLVRALGRTGLRGSIAGGVCAAPLMLCSCCVTPIFTSVYERGARLGSSLALMLGAPGLNVAAIALTFAVLPPRLAVARLASAVVVVFGLSAVVGRALEPGTTPRVPFRAASAGASDTPEDGPATFGAFARRFAASLGYLVVVTVPLIAVGVVVSALVLPRVPALGSAGVVGSIALVALFGVVVALPTFFEIPLALVLLQLGAPPGAAVALVVAGPIVNLPSLLVLARETRPRVAFAVGGGVWLVAVVAGLVVSAWT
jgi:uncharacterized membrane protein YraQ (UPF0718 family)